MEWVLKCSIWREGNWYVSRCEELEIASQGETFEEAQENLEEALGLFFEVASYTEVMEYLSRFGPVSPTDIQKQPQVRVRYTHQESQRVMGEVAVIFA